MDEFIDECGPLPVCERCGLVVGVCECCVCNCRNPHFFHPRDESCPRTMIAQLESTIAEKDALLAGISDCNEHNYDRAEQAIKAHNRLASELAALRGEIAEKDRIIAQWEQHDPWIPVSRSLPADGQNVIVTDGFNWDAETYPYQLARTMGKPPEEQFDCPATHWMPRPALPSPPALKEQK